MPKKKRTLVKYYNSVGDIFIISSDRSAKKLRQMIKEGNLSPIFQEARTKLKGFYAVPLKKSDVIVLKFDCK